MPTIPRTARNDDTSTITGMILQLEEIDNSTVAAAREHRPDRLYNSGTNSRAPLHAQSPSERKQAPNTTAGVKSPSCMTRLCAEINPCHSYWFQVIDSPVSVRTINIPASFAPAGHRAFLLKLVGTIVTVATLIYAWLDAIKPDFFLARLDSLSLFVASLYVCCSLLNTAIASRTTQPVASTVNCWIRTTWILFTVAAHSECMASILWWILEYNDGQHLTFLNFTPHVIIALIVWFDGLVVNRIPVRWTHWWGFVLPLDFAYFTWTVVAAFRHINYNADDDTSSYTAYVFNWKQSLIVGLVSVFALGPIVFLILWMCSLYWIPCICCKKKRKYVQGSNNYTAKDDQSPTANDVEEGSIFARWR
jgi:hypothetical protein